MPLGTQEALSHLKKTYQWIDTFKHKSLSYPKPTPAQTRPYSRGSARAGLPARMCQFLPLSALQFLDLPSPIFANKSDCCWGECNCGAYGPH